MVKHSRPVSRQMLAYIVGGAAALLVARLLLRLLAARPDNPVVQALLGLTAPLVAPLAFLDADQPRFGAVLEFSTLACILLLLLLGMAIWMVLSGRDRPIARER